MPDSVKIAIEAVDNTAAGINSATASLQKLNSATQGFGTTQTNARAIMDGWTKSQYAAAVAGSNLTDRAIQLSNAVNAGKMTVQQATTAYRAFEQQQKANVWQAMTFGEKYRIVSANMNDSVKTIGLGVAKFGALAAGVGYATKQVYDFARAGAEIEYTRQKFDRLSIAAGSTGDVFLNQLRVATKGTVSDFGLLKQGSDLLQLGLAKDTQEAVRLSKVMTALGMDTGELTLALANQSKRRLDQLGLSLTKFNEIEGKLKGSGLSKEDAFKEAFLQTAEQTVLTTGNRADSQYGDYLRTQAEIENLKNNAKIATANAISGDVQNFSNFFRAINEVQAGRMQWTGNILDMLTTQGPVLRQTTTQDMASSNWLWQQSVQKAQSGNIQGSIPAPIYGLSAAQSYAAQGMALKAAGKLGQPTASTTGPVAEPPPPPDYASLLSGGIQLTRMTQSYTEKTGELNEKLTEETAKLDELSRIYGENNKRTMEQAEKVDALKQGVADLNQEYSDAMSNMGLQALQAAEASDEQQLRFAQASGMITQDAYETQNGLNRLARAYADGKIGAESYANAVQNVTQWASAMDEAHYNVYVDVWIRQHGSSAYLGPSANTTTTNSSIEALRASTNGGRAAGGPLNPNGWTIVGDAPGGAFTPFTEAISPDGIVYSASDTRQLAQMGILSGATHHWLTGDTDMMTSSGTYTGASKATKKFKKPTNSGATRANSFTGSGPSSLMNSIAAEAAAASAAAVSDQQMSIASLTNATNAQMVSNSQQGNSYLQAISAKLDILIDKTHSGTDVTRANKTLMSKGSG